MGDSISVYVVDGDDAVLDSLNALLMQEGFAVKLFSSADSLLEALNTDRAAESGFACVLLDLHLPGKGGRDLLEILAERDRRIPMIVMTGNTSNKARERALSAGALAFLEQPVDAEILIDAIKRCHQTE